MMDGIVPTELFPLRKEVENANKMKLDALKTELRSYESRDSGKANPERRTAILDNVLAPQLLEIKVDAQVMLIKNVDGDLVNGSLGRVLGFYMVSEISGSGGQITPKSGNGFIRGVLLQDDGNSPVEKPVGSRECTERFPLVEFRTPLGKEVVLVARDEFKVEDHDGTVAARRVQVSSASAHEFEFFGDPV